MIRAYPETYLNDAMDSLGSMLDYAIVDLGYDPEAFFSQFLVSGVAEAFGRGNPKYVAGLSGVELANEIIYRTEGQRPTKAASASEDKGAEYWAGWVLAYYQWYSAYSFAYLERHGLTVTRVLAMYPTLHEADLSKFAAVADEIIARAQENRISSLKRIRQAKGITQKELAELSGTSLRMIQLYEQKQQDIRKAEAQTLVNIARVLGCSVDELFN